MRCRGDLTRHDNFMFNLLFLRDFIKEFHDEIASSFTMVADTIRAIVA